MRVRWTIAAVAAFGLALVTVFVPKPWSKRTVTSSVACPANAKTANLDFTMKDMHGKDVRLSDYKGKVLLLDFWATWCGPCKVEIPGFVDLYAKYKARGFEVVGVLILDKFDNARPFALQMKMNYPVLNGDEHEAALDEAYGPMFGLPMSFLIARDGRVCQKHLGLPTATATTTPDEKAVKDIFEAEIRSLL